MIIQNNLIPDIEETDDDVKETVEKDDDETDDDEKDN